MLPETGSCGPQEQGKAAQGDHNMPISGRNDARPRAAWRDWSLKSVKLGGTALAGWSLSCGSAAADMLAEFGDEAKVFIDPIQERFTVPETVEIIEKNLGYCGVVAIVITRHVW